ncbi:alpha/beta hydrolase [Roseomonas marmotae]|uniref:Alpha/beta hydrolase n=1 Tax=Roseomonas marmotae TaxID=2768161 RepID=A0ABS3K6E6_9PROT|nr:alpha/beta hydrolase [Roseomonas marmotae]MBO1073024.1 alpha/beta hydrolase [Roseomonas marmotae]QTI79329.1 alpha/beta hydrolase [Roseomonas marmotae]
MSRMLPPLLAAALAGPLVGCAPQVVAQGPAALGYRLDRTAVEAVPQGDAPDAPPPLAEPVIAEDGASLPRRVWPAEGGPPRAVLLALHGFNEHSGNFLLDSVGRLTAAGVEVHAYDQRGFGQAPARGYWPGAAALVRDAATAARQLKARHPDLPLFLMGESMGAAVALLSVTQAEPVPVDGLVLLAPAFWSRQVVGPVGVGLFWALAHSVPALGFPAAAGGIMASDNLDALRRNSRDPLVIKMTRVDAAWGLLDAMDHASAALPRCCAMPVLILQGAKDGVVPPDVTRAALRRMPAAPRLARYQDGYHLLLRDKVREVVTADLLAWMADPAAPLPSGADGAGAAWLARPGS